MDNKVDPSEYQTDRNGGSALETGRSGGTGDNGTNGSTTYPPDQYAAPPQTTPQTPAPTTGTGGGTGTGTGTPGGTGATGGTGAAGGTAPPP
jgi:hypothetical protein